MHDLTGILSNRILLCALTAWFVAQALKIPTIGEGGIWSPEELKMAMEQGVFACVVGTAITRPRDITRRFVSALD